jgi:hypothetical protein
MIGSFIPGLSPLGRRLGVNCIPQHAYVNTFRDNNVSAERTLELILSAMGKSIL